MASNGSSELDELLRQVEGIGREVSAIRAALNERKQLPVIAVIAIAVLLSAGVTLGIAALERNSRASDSQEAGINAQGRDALRPLLDKTGLSDADKDRVADLAGKKILEIVLRDPEDADARILRDWLAAPEVENESARQATEAARPLLETILKEAGTTANLPESALAEVIAAARKAPFKMLADLKRELVSGFLGAIGGIPVDLFMKYMESRFEKNKATCNQCESCADTAGVLPPPDIGAACPTCPACPALVDPRSVELRFDRGRHDLPGDAGDRLSGVVRDAREHPSATVLIWGHTDTVGSKSANIKLAQERVDATTTALIKAGVPRGSIQGFAMGEHALPHPTQDGKDDPGNRLVIVGLGYR